MLPARGRGEGEGWETARPPGRGLIVGSCRRWRDLTTRGQRRRPWPPEPLNAPPVVGGERSFGGARRPGKSAEVNEAGQLSYGPPWAHYLGGYQDRLLGGPLGLPGLRNTTPEGVEHKDYTGVVLG
jgi:hypothetical protein